MKNKGLTFIELLIIICVVLIMGLITYKQLNRGFLEPEKYSDNITQDTSIKNNELVWTSSGDDIETILNKLPLERALEAKIVRGTYTTRIYYRATKNRRCH